MLAAIILAVSIIPYSPIIEDSAATYELNHFYDAEARHVFTQRIWYDNDGQVTDWRMAKREAWQTDRGLLFWDNDGLRRVKTISEIESWSQVDYELVARETLPCHERRHLGKRP